jgi:hypothetical protein
MKIYNSGGFEEFTSDEFVNYIVSNNLKIEFGTIKSLKILKRKLFSNKGNALDGIIECEDKIHSTGLNIGGNPIGTGYKNYTEFLEEMSCQKFGNLYLLNSLINVQIAYLRYNTNINDNINGYIPPQNLIRLYRSENPI